MSVRQQHQEQDHTINNNERANNDKSREHPCKSKSRRGPPKDDEESDGYKSVDHDVSNQRMDRRHQLNKLIYMWIRSTKRKQ